MRGFFFDGRWRDNCPVLHAGLDRNRVFVCVRGFTVGYDRRWKLRAERRRA